MRILVADSDLRELSDLLVILARLLPDADFFAALTADDALDLTSTHSFSIAFIKM